MALTNIENIKYSLYKKSEKLWWASLAGWVLAVLASVLSIFTEQKVTLGIIWIVSLSVPFVITWLREVASDYSFKADKCRRLILYSDGLGTKPSVTELLTVSGFLIGRKVDNAYYEPPYYASNHQGGPARLLDILGESAFFTKELSRKVETMLGVVLVVTLIILVVLGLSSRFWVEFFHVTEEGFIAFVEAFTIFVVSLVAGDIYILMERYSKLSRESEKVFIEALKLKKDHEISQRDVISIASDYDACVQSAPPIPMLIYKKYMRELNTIYKAVSM